MSKVDYVIAFGVMIKDRIATMNKSLPNFERLVLGCMDSYDSEKRRIFQGSFSKSTRFAFFCTAQTSKFVDFLIFVSKFLQILPNFCKIS